jgi:hypothetical protein
MTTSLHFIIAMLYRYTNFNELHDRRVGDTVYRWGSKIFPATAGVKAEIDPQRSHHKVIRAIRDMQFC